MQKGFKHKKETKEKIRIISFTRDNTNRIKSLPKKEKHWNWNPNPNKAAIHRRLNRWYGKATNFKCCDCENMGRDWSNETGVYSDKLEDYKPRCRSCHVKKDKNWIKK